MNDTIPATYDAEITLPTVVKTGYNFDGWFDKAQGESDATKYESGFHMPDNPLDLYAHFSIVEYSITYDLVGGALAEGVTNVAKFTVETPTFALNNPTKDYYTFAGWTLNNEVVNEVAKGTVGPLTIVATWTIKSYKLTINNTVKYYKVDNAVTNLTAYNYRRSLLDVKKVVTGKSAPEDSTFTFTYKITDSTITTPTVDGDDIWFSVRDKDDIPVFDAVVTNATAEANTTVDTNAAGITEVSIHGDLLYYRKNGSDVNKVLIIEDQGNGVYLVNPGFYYARSGSEFTVEMKAGYDLRITNLPTDSTYEITEATPGTGYNLVSVVEGTKTSTNAKYEGTISNPNTKYLVTYTNEYTLTDVPVTKVWDDNSDQDGFRPDETGITLKLTGGAEDITKTIKPGDDGVTISDDGNSWMYTFKDLPAKDAEGHEKKRPGSPS